MDRRSLCRIAADVSTGVSSAEQVAHEALASAVTYDAIQPQAWISRRAREDVLASARRVDALVAAGERLPLAGVPFVFNREYVSGGSSSGSAVVVAAGIVPLALGSDTAGSGRVPAAFNNLVGLKPTRGRWSTRGLVPVCRTLDCITSLTVSAEDAALVDSVIAGFDAADPYSRRPAVRLAPEIGLPFRFGRPRADQLEFLGDSEAASLYRAALERLTAAGGSAVEIDIAPLLGAARLLYSGPWVAERTAVVDDLLTSNPGAIHPAVRAIVQAGKGISAVDAFRGLYALQDHARAAESIWERVDLLALHTARRAEPVKLAVVGAPLSGMPLHWQLASRGARLARRTRTAPVYRLFAMRGQTPPKPALVHVGPGGGSIELEVYELDAAAFGSFAAEVPAPLAIGTVVLADGASVPGFVAEPRATEGAEDITAEGGWRAYLAGREHRR